MFIGAKSKSTLLDVFHTGLKEVIRALGMPKEVCYKTDGCEIRARGADLSKRIDQLRFIFAPKEDASHDEIAKAMEESKIGGRVVFENGHCVLVCPPFEWRQLPQLLPIDRIVEQYSAESLRSRTWSLEVTEFAKSPFNINTLIESLEEKGGSDLHLRAGAKPFIRVDNDLVALDLPTITAEDMKNFMLQLGGQTELDILFQEKESSFQYHAAGIGYLRCSAYFKTGAMAIAIRLIPEEPIPFEKLNLPPVITNICNQHRGMFLVCGITGSGKSTTLAALINRINETRRTHIITIEDPVEFVYQDKLSIVSQRQVGRDTYSFHNALKGALREDPDVILVGEMRDIDTIRAGLSAAETGHMLLSTLHTTTAVDTVNRMISYFPQSERDLIRQEIAYTLKGVVCQRLLKKIGGGRVPAVEILLGGRPIVRDAIIDGDLDKLHGIMEVDSEMRTFDQYAVELYQKGIVTREQAISACADEEAFTRVISGIKSSEGRRLLK